MHEFINTVYSIMQVIFPMFRYLLQFYSTGESLFTIMKQIDDFLTKDYFRTSHSSHTKMAFYRIFLNEISLA